MTYRLIDHTGDIGIEALAPGLESLFAEAARAMFDILARAPEPRPAAFDDFEVPGKAPADELRDFLAELLYRFSAEHKVYVSFEPRPGRVRAGFEPFDPARHEVRTELKAVTYHRLEAVREKEGWRASVIFDV